MGVLVLLALRVVQLGLLLAGPPSACTAGLRAQVIKVEDPGDGHPMRQAGP